MMSFDFSFTQDPEWIANREVFWEKFVDIYAETSTRREMELEKEYFFTGIKPKKGKIHQDSLVWLFPSHTKEALEYVFSNYIKETKVSPQNYTFYQTIFLTNLPNWPGTTPEDQLNLYRMFFGDRYDPDRKFPFLIGKEKEYRSLTLTANDMVAGLTQGFRLAITDARPKARIYFELIDYWLSVIPYTDSWVYSKVLTEEQRGTFGSFYNPLCRISEDLGELFESMFKPSEYMLKAGDLALINHNVDRIRRLLDNLTGPKELVEHWQWAKQEYGHE